MEYPLTKGEMVEKLLDLAKTDDGIRELIADTIYPIWDEIELAYYVGIEPILTAEEQLSRYEEAKADRKNGK